MQPRKYTTYERDANGADKAMSRRYEGRWNRFTQHDPSDDSYDAGDPQSFNRYSYVENDPVNSVDPKGLLISFWLPGADMGWPDYSSGFFGWGNLIDRPHTRSNEVVDCPPGHICSDLEAFRDGVITIYHNDFGLQDNIEPLSGERLRRATKAMDIVREKLKDEQCRKAIAKDSPLDTRNVLDFILKHGGFVYGGPGNRTEDSLQ